MKRKRRSRAPAVAAAVAAAAAGVWLFTRRPASPRGDADARKYFYEDVQRPFFVPDPGDPASLINGRPGSTDGRFARAKAPGTFRVFIVGGSIAQRYGGAGSSSLQSALRLVLPSKTIEVLNCGMRGYESYRELALIRELSAYAPDAFVLLSAQNEGMGSPPIALWRLHLMDWLRARGLDFGASARLAEGRPVDASSTQEKVNAVFRENLGKMAEAARASGARLVVVLPPLNYRGNPPPGPFQPYTPLFAPGWLKYLRGDAAGAMAAWEAAVPKMDSLQASFARFYLGRAAERLGLWAQARAFYAQAYDDPAGWRAGPRRLEAMRAVARERGLPVADADAAFRAKAFPKMPGLEVFDDSVHWFESANDAVTLPVLAALRADPAFAALPWNDAAAKRLSRLVAAGKTFPGERRLETLEEESLTTLRQALAAMPGMTEGTSGQTTAFLDALLDRTPGWFRDLGALCVRAEGGSAATRRVWGQAPLTVDRPRLFMHLAQVQLERGRAREASALAARALERDPSLIAAQESLAVARALTGDEKGARESLDRLTRDLHRPREAEVLKDDLLR